MVNSTKYIVKHTAYTEFFFAVRFTLYILLLPLFVFTSHDGVAKEMEMKKAYFAGGCFWCMEAPFEKTAGVIGVDSGYVNSNVLNPTYDQVSEGDTGAYEAIEVIYNPAKVTYEDLLNVFWTTIDPTQGDGQFGDRGSQYLTGIFYQNSDEKIMAQESKKILDESKFFKKPVTVEVMALKNWTRAEEYHQDYYKKNATHYNAYSVGSGRKGFLDKTWNKKPYCPLRKISLEKVKEIEKNKK